MVATAGFPAHCSLLTLCFSPRRPVMAGSGSTWPSRKQLFKALLLVLVALVLLHSALSEPSQDFVPPGRQKREAPADLLSQMGRAVRGTLDAWIGPETMHVASEVREVVPAGTAHTEEDTGGDVGGHSVSLALRPACHNPWWPQSPHDEADIPASRAPIV